MSQAILPNFASRGFSSYKRPTFSTRISKRNSGRTKRAANYTYPLYEFELSFNGLRSDAIRLELQTLMGFFLSRQGQFDTFLYLDPTDNLVTSQVIGVGDGSTVLFPLVRNMGGWVEPIGQAANQPTITVGGVANTAWGLVLPNQVQFEAPPAIGAQIIVQNLQFYFVCCFDDDQQEFENFMYQMWLNKSVKFTSVKP